MNHVWVVTTGEYSDFHICAVFTSEARAEEYTERFKKQADYTGFDLEKWPLDQLEQLKGKHNYHVQLSRNGDVLQVRRSEADYILTECPREYSGLGYNQNVQRGRLFWASVTTGSEESAIKIANEKRVQFIAAGKWDQG